MHAHPARFWLPAEVARCPSNPAGRRSQPRISSRIMAMWPQRVQDSLNMVGYENRIAVTGLEIPATNRSAGFSLKAGAYRRPRRLEDYGFDGRCSPLYLYTLHRRLPARHQLAIQADHRGLDETIKAIAIAPGILKAPSSRPGIRSSPRRQPRPSHPRVETIRPPTRRRRPRQRFTELKYRSSTSIAVGCATAHPKRREQTSPLGDEGVPAARMLAFRNSSLRAS